MKTWLGDDEQLIKFAGKLVAASVRDLVTLKLPVCLLGERGARWTPSWVGGRQIYLLMWCRMVTTTAVCSRSLSWAARSGRGGR